MRKFTECCYPQSDESDKNLQQAPIGIQAEPDTYFCSTEGRFPARLDNRDLSN